LFCYWKLFVFNLSRQILGFDQASSNVQWMVIRNNSSFLYKRKLGTFTTVCIWIFLFYFIYFYLFKEPNNLKNRNNFRYNGLIHPKVVGVEAVKNGKGVVFTTGSLKSMDLNISYFYYFLKKNLLFRFTKTS